MITRSGDLQVPAGGEFPVACLHLVTCIPRTITDPAAISRNDQNPTSAAISLSVMITPICPVDWLAGSACWSAYESNSIPVCTQYRFRLACSWKYRYWLSSRLVVPSIYPSVSQSWWFCSPFLMWVLSIYPAHMSILPSSEWLRLSNLSSNPFGLLARSSSLFTLRSSLPLLLVAFLISTHPRLLFSVALWCGV